MVSFKTGGLRLLQAAALASNAAARCTRCSPLDKLLVLFGEQDQSEVAPFCATFLGIQASTVEATVTVTPTDVASLTTTVVVTDVSTVFEEIITVTVPAPTPKKKAKRSIEYPGWLPSTYDTSRVSSACQCLSIAPSATTVTVSATAEAVTVTEHATVTETTTSTLVTIGIVTVTATPTPTPTPTANPNPQHVKIAVYRVSTGQRDGYIYLSNGPAITTDVNAAITVDITSTGGASTLRLTPAGSSVALGFSVAASQELKNSYGSVITGTPTPPGSFPVTSGTEVYETDIWTVDTETSLIGWKWIARDGSVSPLALYRVGGRLYPVGSLTAFNTATGGVSSASKYEVTLKYELVA